MHRFRTVVNCAIGLAMTLSVAPGFVRAASVDPLTPANAEVLVQVRVPAVLKSKFVDKHARSQIDSFLQEKTQLTALFQELRFDPLQDAESLTVALMDVKVGRVGGAAAGGLPNLPAGEVGATFAILRGRFDLEQIHTVLGRVARDNPDTIHISRHQGKRIYETKQDEKTSYVAFLDARTLVAGDKRELVTAAIDQGSSKAELRGSMKTIVSKIGKDCPAWAAFVIPAQAKKNLQAPAIAAIQGVTVELHPTDDLAVDLRIHTTNRQMAMRLQGAVAQARAMGMAMANQQPNIGPALTELLSRIRVRVQNQTVQVRLVITSELLDKLQQAASGN